MHYLIADKIPASAHLVISREGNIYQLVNFKTQAWHAGKNKLNSKTSLNKYSVGIELDNAGLLHKKRESYYTWFGTAIPDNQVVPLINPSTGKMDWWHTYQHVQLDVLKNVCLLLLRTYPFRRIVGHNEISLSGKIDSGPATSLYCINTKIPDYQINN